MKKQLFSLMSCLLIGTAVQGQIFFENFENPNMETYPNWTATERDGDQTGMHNKWHASPPYSVSGFSGQWVAASFAGTATTSIDHLFGSPVISLPSGNTFLSYKVASATPAGERYAVYILPAGSNFQGTEIPLYSETITSQSAITRSINIPANLAGRQIKLYFRHFEQGNVFLYLDDVRVMAGTLSVSESANVRKVNVDVYPNPVKNDLYIKSPEKIVSTEVFDMAGRGMQVKYDGSVMNMSKLGTGNYILKIETDKGIITKKIIKE